MNDNRMHPWADIEDRLRAAGRELDRPLTSAEYRRLRVRADVQRERPRQPRSTVRPQRRRPLVALGIVVALTAAVVAMIQIPLPWLVGTTVVISGIVVVRRLVRSDTPTDPVAASHRRSPSMTALSTFAGVGVLVYLGTGDLHEAIMIATATAALADQVADRTRV